MQERNERLAERLRTAEQARDLLVDLERRLEGENDPELERLLGQLDQLAQSLPDADRVRWFVESGAGSARARDARKAETDVSRSRSAKEGKISTLRGTLRCGIT